MPPFSANLTMLFGEVCFGNRFGAAARAGFARAGYLFRTITIAGKSEPFSMRSLTQVLPNLPAGNWHADHTASRVTRTGPPSLAPVSTGRSSTSQPLDARA